MNTAEFLDILRSLSTYRDQIVYSRSVPPREPLFAAEMPPLSGAALRMLDRRGITRLYSHQHEAVDTTMRRQNVTVVTGPASGKTLCYQIPIIDMLARHTSGNSLLLFPTKALCQDQSVSFTRALEHAGIGNVLAGVLDGDTPAPMRRKLRDHGRVLFTNPDMLHAAIMPQHGRWAAFFSGLELLVIDELHVYNGIFGTNMTQLLRRLFRVCAHYGADPQVICCSATIGNPRELSESLTGRRMTLIDNDGSGRGERTYVFWNPPRVRGTDWRSRRSANVEAHEIMAALLTRGVPTIAFSKAKMTAEMIHRYVSEALGREAPALLSKITPYRGGYRPEERRDIEARLFGGKIIGVSATNALELGIDIGGLDASIIVGYPGTLASFFQQSGRAGRREQHAFSILIGLDTAINQYVMTNPEYLFGRPIEDAVLDPDNPFVITGHLRCATFEIPLSDTEVGLFGAFAPLVLEILEQNLKVKHIEGKWYHAATEVPHHEVSLRDYADANVMIEDIDSKEVIGELNKYDAPPILHPEAIYMHRGDTYRVLSLDLEKNIAQVKRVEVDYYTQPLGGTDVHHIDNKLREKTFGTGRAAWGEVTAYFDTWGYEKVNFYSLDAISRHGVDLPKLVLETMAVWIVPPEELMVKVRSAGLDVHSGLRGVGYAARMLLPLFMTCDTLSFSHSVGSVNSPWNAVFIYERYPLGMGFTAKAYERLHEIMPAVLDTIVKCTCEEGCPCCVGKPLRQATVWNVERGEGSIPSKASARMILEGLLGDGTNLVHADSASLTDSEGDRRIQLERAVRRRLERMREPTVFHQIEPEVPTAYPDIEKPGELPRPDVAKRNERRRSFDRDLHRRIAQKIGSDKLPPDTGRGKLPDGMKTRRSNLLPSAFPGRPAAGGTADVASPGRKEVADPVSKHKPFTTIVAGDPLASRARKMRNRRREG